KSRPQSQPPQHPAPPQTARKGSPPAACAAILHQLHPHAAAPAALHDQASRSPSAEDGQAQRSLQAPCIQGAGSQHANAAIQHQSNHQPPLQHNQQAADAPTLHHPAIQPQPAIRSRANPTPPQSPQPQPEPRGPYPAAPLDPQPPNPRQNPPPQNPRCGTPVPPQPQPGRQQTAPPPPRHDPNTHALLRSPIC